MSSNTNCASWRRSSDEEDDKDNITDSHQTQDIPSVSSSQSRILDIQRDKWDAMIRQTEKLWESDNARIDAVLARLRCLAQQDVRPSSQALTDKPRHRPESSVLGQTFRVVPSLLPNDEEEVDNSWTTKTQILQQDAETHDVTRSWRSRPSALSSSGDSLGSLYANSPSELRANRLTENTTARQKRSRLPVMTMQPNGHDKDVGTKYRVQTVRGQVEAIQERLQHLYEDSVVFLPQPPVATRKTHKPVMTHVTPVPLPQPSPCSKKEIRCRTSTRPIVSRSKDTKNTLANPMGSLALCLKLLSSEDWKKKLEGLESVQALTQHHPDELLEKLSDVCPAVVAEVKNLRSSIACAAMDTIVYLAVYLQKAMDPQVERAAHALLLKIAQSSANSFVKKKVNVALEALVQNCSPFRVLNVLVNKGLRHLSAAVRASTAQKLHLLVDTLGVEAILSAGKSFTESFISAVGKMSLDAAPDVRSHGHAILQQLAPYGDFMKLWTKKIEEKDRHSLRTILRNATQAVDLEQEMRLEALIKF